MVPLKGRLAYAWDVITGRAYEAAQSSAQHLARPPYSDQSPDSVVALAGDHLRAHARNLDENHDIAIGVLDDLVTNVVGKGIIIEPLPEIGGRVQARIADQILLAWEEWARSPEVTGELPWGELQRLSCRAWLRDGEFFAQNVRSDSSYPWTPGEVRYQVEYLESDMVPADLQRDDPRYRYGVFLDDWNRPRAYDVYLRRPNDARNQVTGRETFASRNDVKQVSADNLMHIKFTRRWPQTRGVPIIHGIIRRLNDLKDYEESERIAARVAASLCAYIRKSPDNAPPVMNVEDDRSRTMKPGMIFADLLPGEEIGTIDTNRPSTELLNFRNAMLRAIASGTGTRYSSIAKDYSGTYSSQRQELVEARPHYLRLREYYVEKFVRPVYENFVRQAWAQGIIQVPSSVPLRDVLRADYIGPGQPWIDPLKEVQAFTQAVESGFMTREQVIRGLGGDPRNVEEPEPQPTLVAVDDDEEDPADTGT